MQSRWGLGPQHTDFGGNPTQSVTVLTHVGLFILPRIPQGRHDNSHGYETELRGCPMSHLKEEKNPTILCYSSDEQPLSVAPPPAPNNLERKRGVMGFAV